MLLIAQLRREFVRYLLAPVFLFFGSSGLAQSLSLSVQKAPLEKVFSLIEKQSPYRFLYTEELLLRTKPVTIEAKNINIDSLLRLCLKDQPISFSKENQHIILRKQEVDELVQWRSIKGRVINSQGEAMAGITVAIKGTILAQATEANGEFYFAQAPQEVTLIISGVGIQTKEVPLGPVSYISITVFPQVRLLDETVVIAYGRTTQRTTTSTVQKVSKAELERQPVTNALAAIQGRVSGLQISSQSGLPGSDFTVLLRGQNSLANGNEPLYIIDGIPFPSRTLTSELGGAGGANSSPLASLNPADIESIEVLKDADATAIYGSRGANGVILITTKKARAGQTRLEAKIQSGWGKSSRQIPLLGLKDYLSMRREGFKNDGTTPTNSNARDLLLWDTTRSTDWQKLLIGRTMHQMDVNLGISGGSEQTQLSVSGGYHKENTILPGDFGQERVSIGFNTHHQSLDKKLDLNFSGSYQSNRTFLPKEDISVYLSLAPNAPAIYNSEGKFNWENSTWTNPIALLERTYHTQTANLLSNLSLSYRFSPSWEAKLLAGFTVIQQRERTAAPDRSFDPRLSKQVSAGFGQTRMETFILEPQLNFHRSFGKARFHWLAGATLQGTDREAKVDAGTGYLSDDLLASLQGASSVFTISDEKTKYRYAGLFTRLEMGWNQTYLVTLNARRDGSSRYGPAARFANFGSVGAAWIFSREAFFKRLPWLSFGKLKGSHGLTGNDRIGDYRYLDIYLPYYYTYQSVNTLYPAQLYSPDFRWEKVTKSEISLDLGFLKDRLLFSANYYHNVTQNQLLPYALPSVTGFSSILQNLPAKIRNNGWELDLRADLIRQSKWQWSARLMLTIPKNRLLSFENLAGSSYANTYEIGQPLSIVKKLHLIGVDSATGIYRFKDVDGDGRISSPADNASIVFTGQRYYGAIESNWSWGNIKWGVFIQFVNSPHVLTYITRFSRPGAFGNQPRYVLDRWQQKGQVTDIQRFSNSGSLTNSAYTNFRNSDGAYGDGSFVRIKNIYASYDLPLSLRQRWHLQQASFFVQLQNPFTLSSYRGLDPETLEVIPPLKQLTLGCQFTL